MIYDYGDSRPVLLKIMGSKWEVEWHASIDEMALCDFKAQKIQISKDVAPSLAGDVLIHEVMHVLWWFAAIGGKGSEERVVSLMASGLNQVISANEGLGRWLDGLHHSPV